MIVAAGAVLRFATLGLQSFSDDELFTAWLVRMPFGDMLSTVPESEATPHLFYVLEWLSTHLFGTGEVGMRILPALAGTLTVPVVYVAGAIAASRRVALAAAAFVAVSPFLVWYSQEARAYSLLVLFAALSLASLAAFERTGRDRALAAWALAAAGMLATHYYGVFLVTPQAAWLLVTGAGDIRRRAIATAVPGAVGAALVPLAVHQAQVVSDPGGTGSRTLAGRAAAIPKNFLVGFSIPAEAIMTALAAAAAVVALALAWRSRRGGTTRWIGLPAGLAVCAVAIPLAIAPLGFDYVASRSVIAALVPAALVLAGGFAAGRAGAVALAVLVAVSLATVVGVAGGREYQRPDWRGAARALGPARTERLVVFNPPFSNPGPFRVYFGESSRRMPRGPRRVAEIAVVALGQLGGFGPGAPRPPAGRAGSPPAGFRRVQDVRTTTYRVVRFRAPRPLPVTRRELAAMTFPDVSAVAIEQSPGRRR